MPLDHDEILDLAEWIDAKIIEAGTAGFVAGIREASEAKKDGG
jgi:hypothetical protein